MKRDAIAAILSALNDECGRLNPMDDPGAFDRNRGQIHAVLDAVHAVGRIRAEDVDLARMDNFNESGGALSWCGRSFAEHPNRCGCQGNDSTPHRHYTDAPYRCARCIECDGYAPVPVTPAT